MKMSSKSIASWLGAALIALAPLAHANVVQNSGFENWDNNVDPNSISAWDLNGTVNGTPVNHSTVGSGAFPPDSSIRFSLDTTGSVSQVLSSLAAGSYKLNFFLNNYSTGLDVMFGSTDVNFVQGATDGDWVQYSATFDLTAGGTLLFSAASPRADFFLDDVTLDLVPPTNGTVPEPGTLLLVGAALAAGALIRRKKQM